MYTHTHIYICVVIFRQNSYKLAEFMQAGSMYTH